MSYVVVVLLVEPQNIHCVVPEEYIHGLSEIQGELKTWGINKQHKSLIYWSDALLDDDAVPNTAIDSPNWDLEIANEFPPNDKSACYYGRIKGFYGMFTILKLFFLIFHNKYKSYYNM